MAAAFIELQARQVAHEQPGIAFGVVDDVHRVGFFRFEMGKAVNLVDQHRVALLGHEQALAGRVVRQPLEPLVAVQANAQGQLLGIAGIEEHRVVVKAHAYQPLLTLVGDHVAVGPDVLHRLWVAKTGQRNSAQDAAVQRQLDQLRTCIGNGEQGLAVGVVGQRRNVGPQAFDRTRLDHHLVAVQPHALLGRLPPGLEVEPAPLEQAKLLPGPTEQEQANEGRDQ